MPTGQPPEIEEGQTWRSKHSAVNVKIKRVGPMTVYFVTEDETPVALGIAAFFNQYVRVR